jgi:antitoxin CptB
VSDDPVLRRLRWRCRRGMRELDQLMLRYLDDAWPTADDAERAVFLRLLDCEDDKLWRWFMGRERPEADDIHALVRRIADLPH